jgi:hypothetical protein
MEVIDQVYALLALPPRKHPRYALDWPQIRSGRGGEETKIPSLHVAVIEPRSSSQQSSHYTD